jgi:uncharacterized membrane protein
MQIFFYLYNSKPMSIIPYVLVYHIIRYNLIHSLLHACIYKLVIFIILLFTNYFHKIEFTLIQNVFHVSCKHACLIYEMIMICENNNDKYSCELYSLEL